MTTLPYIGRFAPSPTGPLHFGSLLAAVASYCDAKHHQGQWFVRIEDTDWQRNVPYAIEHIYNTLDAFALVPDQAIRIQSQHFDYYEQLLTQLKTNNLVYACACSRKQLADYDIYPNFCRNQHLIFDDQAVRLKVPSQCHISFNDLQLGTVREQVDAQVGDFVLKRRDGIYSYQLCVVGDDALQNVTHVVRGADLLDNTARQIYLQRCLNFSTPEYLHLPLAKNKFGQKLSKQNLALPLDLNNAPTLLKQALFALGQPIPLAQTTTQILQSAVVNWQRQTIPQAINKVFR